MAKMQGIVGGLSGKMGNAVFRQRYGQTIVAQYQPVVSNPNTPAQQTARAAFKLITQLAAIMAPAYGTLGVVTRPARQGRNSRTGFVAKNYGLIVADPSPEAAERVTIAMEKLQLTESFRPLGSLALSSGDGEPRVAQATAAATDIRSIRFVEVGYVEMDGVSQAAIINMADIPVVDGNAEYPFISENEAPVTILAYGLIPSEDALRKVDFNNIHTPEGDEFLSAVQIEKMVRDGDLAVTMTAGLNSSFA